MRWTCPHLPCGVTYGREARKTVSDNQITAPGALEDSAMNALNGDRTEEAQVLAILALASAVNRLAAAQEAIANA